MTQSGSSSKGAAYAGLATQLFGLAGQVAGSFYSARSQKTQARLQADLAEHNARMAEMGARQALFSGQRQAAARCMRPSGSPSGTQRRLWSRGAPWILRTQQH